MSGHAPSLSREMVIVEPATDEGGSSSLVTCVMAVVYRDWVGAGKGGVVVKRGGGGAGTNMIRHWCYGYSHLRAIWCFMCIAAC